MPKTEERRRYIRLREPIDISYAISGKDKIMRTISKDISAVGTRFETAEKIESQTTLELTLQIPNAPNPVHASGKIVWTKRLSLEDSSPYETGVEFTKIEEDNKNTFLKYMCDLTYGQTKE